LREGVDLRIYCEGCNHARQPYLFHLDFVAGVARITLAISSGWPDLDVWSSARMWWSAGARVGLGAEVMTTGERELFDSDRRA